MSYFIAALTTAILFGLSILAERRWRVHERLPMQWGFHGQVNWTAPRRIALSCTPLLAAICLFAIALQMDLVSQAPANAIVRVTGIVAAAFLFAHLLHLGLLARWHAKHTHGKRI